MILNILRMIPKQLYFLIALLFVLLAVEQYGEHRVHVKWDFERERLQTIADIHSAQDKVIVETIEAKHKKDIEHAKSQAGRNAVAAWLKSHGMLPDGSSVSGSGGGQTDCTGKPDATPGESGTSQHIEEFAQACALDALKVLNWQAWAIREGLTTK